MASSPVTAPPSGDASSPPSPPASTSPPGDGSSPPGDGSSPPAPPTSTSPPSNSSSSSSPPAPPTSASPPSNSSSSSPPPAQSPPSPPPASSPPSNSSKTPPSSPPPSGQTPPSSGQTDPAPPAPTTGGGEGSSTSPPADGGSPPATPTPPAAGSGGGTTPASPPPADNNNPSPTPPNSSSSGGSGSPPSGGSSNNSPALPATPSSPSLTPPSSSSGVLLSPPMGGTMVAEPTPAHKTPSAKHTTPSSGTTSSSPTAPSTTAVVGVGVSAALIALVMVVLCVTCASKKKNKKRKHGGNMQYYADHSAGPKGGEYYSGQNNWNNANHVMKVPPPPGMGGGSWGPPQGPASGDMSGNFSGGPHGGQMPPPTPGLSLGFNKSTFSYDELAAATNGFSQANLLGQGGFGFVHKGVLPNGKEIAVKSLKSGSGQGEREFQAEVEIISRVHHRHLVSLVGYCIAEDRRMLVYEFVPNGTMEYHLHGKGRPTMDWPARLRIALGSAKGLAYLHEDCHPRIIHRDIKAANILIDNNFEAMVADFGLAKLSSDNYTHVSTRVMGTFGYLAPEYASSGKLTEKSDVFSFGIMLLELITGRKPVDTTNTYMEDSLVDWARPILSRSLEDGNFDELVDPNLEGNYSPPELSCMVACAAAAVRHSAKRRPKMSQIVRALEGDASLDDLNEGVKPGQSSMYGSNGSSDYDTGLYNADMQKFRKVVMSSQEFASSEYGGTSEYGLNPSSSSGDSQEMPQPWKRNPQPRNNNIS